jgi:WD40 repeat protein
LLWLMRALELAPETDADFARAVRAELADWRAEVTTRRVALKETREPPEPGGSPYVRPEEFDFSPDGRTVRTKGLKGVAEVQVRDAQTGQPVGNPLRLADAPAPGSCEFVADGTVVALWSGRFVRLADASTGEPLTPRLDHPGVVGRVAVSRDRKLLLTSAAGGFDRPNEFGVYLWDVAAAKILLGPLRHGTYLHSVSFVPGDTSLLTADTQSVRLWDRATGTPTAEYRTGPNASVMSVVPVADGRNLLVRGYPDTRLLDGRTLRPVGNPLGAPDTTSEVTVTPDGMRVVTRRATDIQVWDALTGAPDGPPLRFPPASPNLSGLLVSPDGRRYVTLTRAKGMTGDPSARLIDGATGAVLAGPLDGVSLDGVLFDPAENLVVVTAREGKGYRLHVWSADTGKPRGEPVSLPCDHVQLRLRPDGKAVLIKETHYRPDADPRGVGRWWDVTAGRPLGDSFPLPWSSVVHAISPDGRRMTFGNGYSALDSHRLWDASTGAEVDVAPGAVVVLLSPERRSALAVRRLNGQPQIQLWDCATRTPMGEPLPFTPGLQAFSPDGRTVLIAAGAEVHVRDAATGRPVREPLRLDSAAFNLLWSPDGRRTVLLSQTRAQLWDVIDGRTLSDPIPYPAARSAPTAAFDDRGTRVAGIDPTGRRVVVWNAAPGRPACDPIPTTGSVVRLELRQNGGLLAIEEWQGGGKNSYQTVRLWDVRRGRPIGEAVPGDDGSSLLFSPLASVSPDGRHLAMSQGGRTVRLFDTGTASAVGLPMQHPHSPASLLFSPRGDRVLTVTNADANGYPDRPGTVGVARLWEVPSGIPLAVMEHKRDIRQAVFSPDGGLVLTASADGTARLWYGLTGKPHGDALPHTDPVTGAAFGPDGRTVATRTPRETVVWDGAPGRTAGRRSSEDFTHVTPDGELTFTTDRNYPTVIALWDVATGKPLGRPIRESGQLISVTPSPDRMRVLTRTLDGMRLWSAADGEPLGGRLTVTGLPPLRAQSLPHSLAGGGAAFSPDGRWVAASPTPGRVGVWDGATGVLVRELPDHPAPVTQVLFRPDGKTLLTVSADPTKGQEEFRLYEPASGEPIGEPWVRTAPWSARSFAAPAFSPDGRYVLTQTDPPGRSSLRDTRTGKPVGEPLQHPPALTGISFSPDGTRVFLRSDD